MKKFLLLLLAISGLSFAEGNTVELRIGADLSTNSKLKFVDIYDENFSVKGLKNGFEIGAEYRRDLGTGFELGAGFFYKKNNYHNELKEYSVEGTIIDSKGMTASSKGFHSFPIYATARYNFMTPSDSIKPYIKANLGYSINSGKLTSHYAENFSYFNDIAGRLNLDIKFKNGLYYGIGTGIKYNNFSVDLSYNEIHSKFSETFMDSASSNSSSTTGVYEYATYNKKLKNRFVTLSFGYNFEF